MPIDFAQAFYSASDEHILLELRESQTAQASTYQYLSPDAFRQLRDSILGVKCEICGGNHPEVFHGAPIILLDTQRAPAFWEMGIQIEACLRLLDNQTEIEAGHHHKVYGLWHEWKADCDRPDDEQEQDFDHYDNVLSSVLSDAGYVIYNNSDAAAWMLYAAYEEDPT